ncbi:MAG TPA: ABC transporter permease [Nitrospiria bacterium]|nr:ABC transporter permease [Nitrospiria bacterium]
MKGRLPSAAALAVDRLIWSIPVLWLVATMTFILMHLAPGGPFDKEKPLPPEIRANVEAKYHLDEPVAQQYARYLGQLLRGDLGPSFKYADRSVGTIIGETFPVSLQLGGAAFVLTLLLGITGGVLAASRPGAWRDRVTLLTATLGFSLPNFVVGVLLILVLAHEAHWFPPALWEGPRYLVLPALTLALGPAAYVARLTRASLIDVAAQEYVRVGRAKGLPPRVIWHSYLLRAGLPPVITVLGPTLAMLVTGSFIIEYLFSIPGMGRFFITAVTNRDYPLIMGVTLVYAAVIVAANLIVDLLYGWLDPRMRAGTERAR